MDKAQQTSGKKAENEKGSNQMAGLNRSRMHLEHL